MEIFLTLAEELHFGRTAARLHISPALVTQTVKKTERRLGVTLFARTSRRVALTEVGRCLRDDLLPLYQGIRVALDRAELAGRGITGTLTVGFMGTQAGRFVSAAHNVFERRNPDCAVRVIEAQLHHHATQLPDGTADLLLLPLPIEEPDLTVGPVITRSPRYMCLPTGHRLAERAEISAEELAGETFVGLPGSVPAYWTDFHMPRHTPGGREFHRYPEPCGTYAEVLTLVAAGRAIAPGDAQLPLLYQRPDVVFAKVTDLPPVEHALVWRTSDDPDKRIRAFADVVVEIAPALTPPNATLTGASPRTG
ncbi:LysR family transcriptional regulator [Embleya sp. AB8]|uniref:LysR family transcriptional regulator n=1 Tax=Embleya sp. AB8 TaxID=3156304 RepID=UPI003C7967FC